MRFGTFQAVEDIEATFPDTLVESAVLHLGIPSIDVTALVASIIEKVLVGRLG